MSARACIAALVFAAVALAAPAAHAADATPTEQDPVSQARAVKLESELRCLVCQNQTIAESNAELAVDLRRQVREQIAAGRSDREIIDYMTARYGDFVLYRPPFKGTTLLLWAGPAVLLVLGAWLLLRIVRDRRVAEPPPLSEDERARAHALLADEPEKRT
jgi:cytochrome c-type biogenesis protein CcmH